MKKVLFLNGPSQDPSDRFAGRPTPLLYAIAPTIDAIDHGSLNLSYATPIFDPWFYTEGERGEKVKAEIRKLLQGVDILCGSAIYDSLYPTLQLFGVAKEFNPTITTILGGPHFDEIHQLEHFNEVNQNPHLVDFAVAGDGEYILMELLRELSGNNNADLGLIADKSKGKGWLYSHRGFVQVDSPMSLDELPFIPLHIAPDEHRRYSDTYTEKRDRLPAVQMMAQRGCPYSCSFCSERRKLAYHNVRSVENLLAEVWLRKGQGIEYVFFDDSTFGAYPFLAALLTELGKTGMKFGCLNRFNHLQNPKVLEMYRKAGFTYFYCSIEQFDNSVLRSMVKAQKTQQITQSVKTLNEFGFQLGVSMLYGIPSETQESITTTLDFTQEWVERGLIKLVGESLLSYHPGTPEGKRLEGQRAVTQGFNRTPPNIDYPWNRF